MKMKKQVFFLLKFICTLVLCSAVSTAIRVIGSILSGEHGKPSFVTTGFTIYGIISTALLILTYILWEEYIPFKNRFLKGIVFVSLFWISAFFPQVAGMTGGESVFISKDAMNAKTMIQDGLGYFTDAFIIGGFMSTTKTFCKKPISDNKLIKACLASMILFPSLLAILEFGIAIFYKPILCVNAFGIMPGDELSFYIVFYLFQAISGLIFPLFYRFTEYNKEKPSFITFSIFYGIFLWSPVVIAVIFFGVGFGITIAWMLLMLLAIVIDSFIFGKIMR